MKKIKLVVEELRVQSYATTGGDRAEGGTVHARQQATILECSGHVTCASACSETNGVVVCKTCGPCC